MQWSYNNEPSLSSQNVLFLDIYIYGNKSQTRYILHLL